jgi:hypothetical protein
MKDAKISYFGFVTCDIVWNGVMVSKEFDVSIFKDYIPKCNYISVKAHGVKSLKAIFIVNNLSPSVRTQT